MGHGFMPPITIHIYIWLIVDHPSTMYAVMDILVVVCALLHQYQGIIKKPSMEVKMRDMHQNGAILPVLVFHNLSPVKNLKVHTILHQIKFGSNPISSQFHTCDGQGWMSCRSRVTSCRLPGRFSSYSWTQYGPIRHFFTQTLI